MAAALWYLSAAILIIVSIVQIRHAALANNWAAFLKWNAMLIVITAITYAVF